MEAGGGLDSPLIQLMFGTGAINFGVMGIFTAASVVFFAFIGFDVVATAAEETRNPQRDMPRGILGSLVHLHRALRRGLHRRHRHAALQPNCPSDAPLADAFKATGHPFYAGLISFGAAVGLTTVCMILLLGQTRVFFAMSRDGLLPRFFSARPPAVPAPRTGRPSCSACSSRSSPVSRRLTELAALVNIGTLFAFVVVAIGVMILRRTRPDLPRAFRTPWVPVHPDRVGGRLAVADAQPARGDLGALRRLDGPRRRRLLRVRALPQPDEQGTAPGRVRRILTGSAADTP
ncbi:hypothetical protein SMICM17S_04075 [Streptomyces microflavus]